MPVQCPTMPCFGGDDLRTLFVTSARHGRPAAELARLPASGSVFHMRVDMPGLPVEFLHRLSLKSTIAAWQSGAAPRLTCRHGAILAALIERIRAAPTRTPLRIRGGGSKDFYGEPLVRASRLTLPTLAGITSYEPSELVVTVRAGTPLAELEAVLAEQGQCLPFEPPHFGARRGTVGGMVAAGLSGPARASVGAVRDYVLGAT